MRLQSRTDHRPSKTKRPRPSGTRAHPSRGTTLLGRSSPAHSHHRRRQSLPRSAALVTVGFRSELLGAAPLSVPEPARFTRRLRSELQRLLSQQGFQSPTLPPWRLPPAYSSPSPPLHLGLPRIILESGILSSNAYGRASRIPLVRQPSHSTSQQTRGERELAYLTEAYLCARLQIDTSWRSNWKQDS